MTDTTVHQAGLSVLSSGGTPATSTHQAGLSVLSSGGPVSVQVAQVAVQVLSSVAQGSSKRRRIVVICG